MAVDRVAFAERTQSPGESFDDFYIALRDIAANADLCTFCLDQQLVTRIICGLREAETRRELLAMSPFPSVKQALDVCRSREAAVQNDSLLTSGRADTNFSSAFQVQAATSSPAAQLPPCRYCGNAHHLEARQCPARKVTCNNCGLRGHFAKMCEKTRRPSADPPRPGTLQAKAVTVQDVAVHESLSAPQIVVTLGHISVDLVYGTCQATPDTGADATLMGYALLESLGIEPEQISPGVPESIVAGNGTELRCVGTLLFSISYGGRCTDQTVLVCVDHGGFLLSWYACRELGLIPHNYPEPLPICPPVSAVQSVAVPDLSVPPYSRA